MIDRSLIGIDVGGTFTDVVGVDQSGRLVIEKLPSDPVNPAGAVIRGVRQLADTLGVEISRLLAETDIVHGTTMGLNKLLTRTGARVGLLTTAGFRDILEMRVGSKENKYDLSQPPPEPLVPRRLRVPVRERIDAIGRETVPLEESEVEQACAFFEEEGVESVAICFLWSFLEPAHEKRAAEICRRLMPDAYVTASWDVLPEIREYDRVSTTALNAYVGPQLVAYTEQLEDALRAEGLRGAVRYLQSNGGVANRYEVTRVPARTLLSGPAAAPIAARVFAMEAGKHSVISIDMGGTSFDTTVMTQGAIRLTRPVELDTVRLGFPVVDVRSVGGGGGSIASVDAGILRVGPRSAGAVPGPAAYGKGGDKATVTDANLILGIYGEGELPGGLSLSHAPAQEAIERLAGELGVQMATAAEGIRRVVNLLLADTVHSVTVAEGKDPRDYVLLAGGGSGAAHCCAIAEQLGITEVLVPKIASTLAAFGAIATDVVHEARRSLPIMLNVASAVDEINERLRDLYGEVLKRFDDEGLERDVVDVTQALELRYKDQLWEISIPIGSIEIDAHDIDIAIQEFHRHHHELYTYSEPESPCELVSLLVKGVAKRSLPAFEWGGADDVQGWEETECRPLSVIDANGEALGEVPVFSGERAPVGQLLTGPALINELNMTIFVQSGWNCLLEKFGAYRLQKTDGTGRS